MQKFYRSFQIFAFRLTLISILLIGGYTVGLGRFIEDFGKAGTFRALKGQVRDGADTPIPNVTIEAVNLKTEESYCFQADSQGRFEKTGLPAGSYRVTFKSDAFNIGQLSVRISRLNFLASTKYLVVRLSPGCATGNSGVATVKKLSSPSFEK
jgi:hypothetical protein